MKMAWFQAGALKVSSIHACCSVIADGLFVGAGQAKKYVVVIEQELVSLVQTRLRFAVSISERVLVYEYSSPFASLLSVVNPSDDGH